MFLVYSRFLYILFYVFSTCLHSFLEVVNVSCYVSFTVKHIKKSDGFLGLYRGVAPRICANLSTSLTYSAVGQVL